MKKLTTHYIILILIASYFMFNGCINRTPANDWKAYANDLQSEGWSIEAAEHIAKVEFKILPIDEEYTAYIED
ncbi:hypothetical protein [Flavobacterium caseinilyticum]|uniref:Uncharacterized protein n=1 Tax=Flavobacterium caseinilyticum TaxID=2541732 RepID=A0A4R5AZ73_9FLAO|nr:hypothetical protein [Flavobacterium caseinilyticum]TDD77156.1 hypothetical protein E0F89_06030 [Flavobacterium caseinilyticum]